MSGHPGGAFLGEVGIVLLAALLGGLVARLLRVPVLMGYLLAGLVVGPHTPGPVADAAAVTSVADLGVVLLMFAVGTQFSLRELRHAGRIALVGGGLQILGTTLLGVGLGVAFGWGVYAGLFLGCALALSSTAVLLKVLEERGELGTAHGGAMLGVLVVQDLALVPMVVLLPALSAFASTGAAALLGVGIALAKALAFLGVTALMAIWGAPALLGRIARTGSRELFLLAVVGLCLVAGYAADQLGLGLALGAFLAGIVVSESGFAQEVFSQVRPLRDVFAALFFVSVGMLLDPRFILSHAPVVFAVVGTILLGKSLVTVCALRVAGVRGRSLVLAGLGLAQIGEFSFVLATEGVARGLVEREVAETILASALLTILLTPLVYGGAGRVYQAIREVPALAWLLAPALAAPEGPAPCPDPGDVIVIGAGRVGRYVSDALRATGVPHTVIDFDGSATARLQAKGVTVVYGDATSESVLAQAAPERASLAVIALPEAASTELVLRQLKRLAPAVPVVVRVHRGVDIPRMRAAGAEAVVHAEFEAGTEMIRQSLERLGSTPADADAYIETVRQIRYREEGA